MYPLDDIQRALYYGDTLFETVRVSDGEVLLADRHWRRLRQGLELLGFEVPDSWDLAFFTKEIKNAAAGIVQARARFTVWRSKGGLYLPTNNTPQHTVTATALPVDFFPVRQPRIGIAQRVRLPLDHFSNVKTMNAPRYVQAAIEAQRQGWDDALLLNAEGRICEATSSNVFWEKSGQLFTVPCAEGCVAGVMRDWWMTEKAQSGHPVQEVAIYPDTLYAADRIFLTNAVRGIVEVRELVNVVP